MVVMDTDEIKPIESYDLVGGAISLDLVNTATGRTNGPFRDRLNSYADLVTWAVRAADLDPAVGDQLRQAGAQNSTAATETLESAKRLRDATYRAFSARARGERMDDKDLAVLSQAYADAVANRKLMCRDEADCSFEWRSDEDLARPLWPAAIDALELLTSEQAARVKECATDNCNWLFVDASKNKSRRWCEMKECGNRAKARRHYQRQRGAD